MEKILVVDNNRSVLAMYEKLNNYDHRFEVETFLIASNDGQIPRGEQKKNLVERLQKYNYDILLMDIMLRDCDEIWINRKDVVPDFLSQEIVKELSKEFNEKNIIVVFTSSFEYCCFDGDYEELKTKVSVFNDYDFIVKPYERLPHRDIFTPHKVCVYPNRACNHNFKDCSEARCFFDVLNEKISKKRGKK